MDIDPQAVEVTKLSLSLKVLEGESQESIGTQLGLFKERALPDLGRNIQWGNSLIHPGEHLTTQINLFDSENNFRIAPFEWYSGFSEIMKGGGFDVIIGNPPYVRPHNIPEDIKRMLWKIYSTFVAKSDMYSCFMERGLTLTKEGGLFSFIVPHTWISLESFTKIREFIIRNSKVKMLVQLPKKVFTDSTVETCIFVIEKSAKEDNSASLINVEKISSDGSRTSIRYFPQKEIESAYLYNFQLYGRNESQSVILKIQEKGEPLSDFVSLAYGFKTADDEQFIHSEKKYEESQPFIRSGDVHRYWIESPKEYVWYVPEIMIRNRKTARPGEKSRFEAEKIIVSRMGKSLVATFDASGLFVKDAMILLSKVEKPSLKFILGVINSSLLTYYYQKFFITIDVLKNALLSLPIVELNFSVNSEKTCYEKMVMLVDRMLTIHKKHARTPQEKEALQREIETTDKQIDALVYELYGLTEEEIRIVEN
ncbi:MAG: TaqI-like C-terminal specificity domain-containing protein [Pelolinea sp.]|nr:TaqI-like C-terminal specificity domain-containing protein [Pelolinea sp.]